MPEKPEEKIFEEIVKEIVAEVETITGMPPNAVLKLLPRVFAEGTAGNGKNKAKGKPGKPYCSVTTKVLPGYTQDLEGPAPSDFEINPHDLKRSKGKPWLPLISQPLQPGPLCVAGRGKGLVIAAGHHAVTVNFGLEAHLVPMSREDFDEIISSDCPGPNSDRGKAQRLRTFPLPSRFVDAASSVNSTRTVNIFAAFATDTHAIALIDFARLIRLHVTSSPHIWSQADLTPSSPYWPILWEAFPDGPDWVLEPELAEEALDAWRARILAGEMANTPLVEAIASNDSKAFGGFGRHLANDFLYLAGIFPNTPSAVICENDYLFDHLRSEIPAYLETFETDEFRRMCTSRPNSKNPFSFNFITDLNYTNRHIMVFRRVSVRMPAALYNRYLEQGFFDPDHILYESYNKPVSPHNGSYKLVPVYFYSAPVECFTVIAARPPPEWKCSTRMLSHKDITSGGYATLIGPAQFREYKVNMINVKRMLEAIRCGRPAKIRTGKRGRPRKTPTRKSIAKIEKLFGRRPFVGGLPESARTDTENMDEVATEPGSDFSDQWQLDQEDYMYPLYDNSIQNQTPDFLDLPNDYNDIL